jgi:signal transduction histidine kinase
MKRIIDKLKIHNRIRVGYGTAFFLLLISYIVTIIVDNRVLEQASHVDSTNTIITRLEKIISDVKDGETGARGFAYMQDTGFLTPYYNSHARIDSSLTILRAGISDPVQKNRLDTLDSLINEKYAIMQGGIRRLKENDFLQTDSIRAGFYKGKQTMDQIRMLADSMQQKEQGELLLRRDGMKKVFRYLRVIIVVSLVIACLLLLFGFLTYMRENKARREADDKVEQYQNQLKQRILELRDANKKLLQMRTIEKFAATGRIARTIAHEIRNPLTNINLAMEQLKAELPPADDSVILFEMVHRNSNRINQLITDLLNSTKFAELSYSKVQVNTMVDEALEMAKDRIALYNITVVKKYDRNICDVEVDKDKMKIALLNIIVNAIEAMEPGNGMLTIATRTEHNKCVIEIADNGAGMDKESMGRLFEPYFTSKPKGNGLGLTNTQNIVLNHKGTIQAESEKNKGTSFYITLDFAAGNATV